MKASEIRQAFLKFAEQHDHAIIPSAPVVPQTDSTTLFNIAGMQPLTPHLLGEPHPAGKRLANVQKCIRTIDIDEVGDDSHATFMEMLGWWSLGDYFKEETIQLSWEFFTKVLKLEKDRIAVTVFAGDKNAPRDEESAELWKKLGIPEDRIFYYGTEDNWWGPAGDTGPCGPSTEVMYWIGEGKPQSEPSKDDRWLELGNNVLMGYEKTDDGKIKPIAQKNVDTGLGFERIVSAVQGKANVYETDLFAPVIEQIRKLSNVKEKHEDSEELTRAERIIADHLKAATFIIADGVRPSNVDQGYVLRRLIRRAVRQARLLKIEYPFTAAIAEVVVTEFKTAYPELEREAKTIREELLKEEEKFHKSLTKGLDKFVEQWEQSYPTETKISGTGAEVTKRVGGKVSVSKTIDGKDAFELFETFGFPIELTIEEIQRRGGNPNIEKLMKEFETARRRHQKQSRAGAKQKFAGGLADHSEKVVRQHTATHLLLAALRDVLGAAVKQRGSNITAERLRFDFSHPEKLTDEQLTQVEALVNEWVREDLPVTRKEMPREEAERLGAQMEFGHKYPDIVSVYIIGDPASARSMEFCGGPHVEHTGQIGQFKIQKQESVGAGVRRLKATLV